MSEAAIKAVKADADTGPEGAVVTLSTDEGDFDILVPPPGKWKSRANRALRDGDFEGWAEIVLSDEDAEKCADADPTNDEWQDFFEAWGKASGEQLGKSSSSKRGSRSTRKR